MFKNDKWFSVPCTSTQLRASSEVTELSPAGQRGLVRFSSCEQYRDSPVHVSAGSFFFLAYHLNSNVWPGRVGSPRHHTRREEKPLRKQEEKKVEVFFFYCFPNHGVCFDFCFEILSMKFVELFVLHILLSAIESNPSSACPLKHCSSRKPLLLRPLEKMASFVCICYIVHDIEP